MRVPGKPEPKIQISPPVSLFIEIFGEPILIRKKTTSNELAKVQPVEKPKKTCSVPKPEKPLKTFDMQKEEFIKVFGSA